MSTIDFFEEYISSSEIVSSNDIIQLVLSAQNGDKNSRDLIIHNNIKLVRHIANYYANTKEELDEYIQCGVIGLLDSINRFDVSKGCVFSTYAVPYIIKEIRIALKKNFPVYITNHAFKCIYDIKKYIKNYANTYMCTPTIKQISDALSIEEKTVEQMIGIEYKFNNIRSLEEPIDSDNTYTLKNYIEDIEQDVSSEVIHNILLDQVKDEVSKLPLMEQEILSLKYNNLIKSKYQIARMLNITPNKVETLERKAKYNLRKTLEKHID